MPKQRQRDEKPHVAYFINDDFRPTKYCEHRLNTNQTDQNTLKPRWISTDAPSTDPTVVGMGMILSR
jgi:hypothetical protein